MAEPAGPLLLGVEEAALASALDALHAAAEARLAELRACDVGARAAAARAEAAAADALGAVRGRLRELELLAEEQETPEAEAAVCAALQAHKARHEALRAGLHDARRARTRAAEKACLDQRAALLAGADVVAAQRAFAGEQGALAAAEDVTASLRRTRQLMSQNVEASAGALAALVASNETLEAAGAEFAGHVGLLGRSRALLRGLKRQASGDRVMLWTCSLLFAAVVGYIVLRRSPGFVKAPLRAAIRAVGWRSGATAAPPAPPAGQQAWLPPPVPAAARRAGQQQHQQPAPPVAARPAYEEAAGPGGLPPLAWQSDGAGAAAELDEEAPLRPRADASGVVWERAEGDGSAPALAAAAVTAPSEAPASAASVASERRPAAVPDDAAGHQRRRPAAAPAARPPHPAPPPQQQREQPAREREEL